MFSKPLLPIPLMIYLCVLLLFVLALVSFYAFALLVSFIRLGSSAKAASPSSFLFLFFF